MVKAKRTALSLIFAAVGAILGAQELYEGYNLNLALELSRIEEAGPPQVLQQDYVLLTYESTRPVRYVGVAFGHEGYSEVHRFRLSAEEDSDEGSSSSRVYFYLANPPEDQEQLRYRYVVDGLWTTDPRNGRTQLDENGVPISVFELPERTDRDHTNPIVTADGRVRFRLHFAEGSSPGVSTIRGNITYLDSERDLRVFVTGSFTNWDPFMYRLRPVQGRPGVYESRPLRIAPGLHRYYFVINGERILDPHNSRTQYHRDGYEVSTFTLSATSTNNDL